MQSSVGILQDITGGRTVGGIQGDSQAGRGMYPNLMHFIFPAEELHQFLRRLFHFFRLSHSGQQHDELIAADSCHSSPFIPHAYQMHGSSENQRIAVAVSIRIIDHFQVINVDIQ